MRAIPATCFGCGSTTIDLQRGWVRPPASASLAIVVYFLCDGCLDRRPSVEWDGDFPVAITFPVDSGQPRPRTILDLTPSDGRG